MDTWKQRSRPNRLEGRFEFASYEETRDFLDKLGVFTEKANKFPDISFGRTYVNITVRSENEDDTAELTDAEFNFASDIDALIS